jgi:hypothetical protein
MATLNVSFEAQVRGARHQLMAAATAVERLDMLATASMFGLKDHADRYSRRVGVETVRSAHDALKDATALIRCGRGELLEPTVVCTSAPLRPTCVEALRYQAVELVDPGFVDALASSRDSLEFRTPPGCWTTVPPKELFSP